jgi:methionyl-tRNA formyltransferase
VSRRLRLLLILEGPAGVESLRMLAGTPHEIVAVQTHASDHAAAAATVAAVAARLGYRLWPAARVRESGFADLVKRERVDLIINVHGVHVIPPEVVTAPRIGSFNLHPGPLPRYAGLNAPSWAIYHGERTHAVTLHWMDHGVDTGPIAYVADIPVEPDETGLTLSGKCIRAGLPLLHDLLTAAVAEQIPRRIQPNTPRRYYGREVPHEGRLLWSESASRVVRFIRACDFSPFVSPWRLPRAYLAGREIAVLKAGFTGASSTAPAGTVGPKVGSEILVAARDQWVRVQRVQVGSSVFAAAEALRPGERFALPTSSDIIPAVR